MKEKRLQILLLGNGLNIAYGGLSWGSMLRKIATNKRIAPDDLRGPMPLRAILLTENRTNLQMKDYLKNIFSDENQPEQNEALQAYLSMGFDHILTTNFTYELEIAALGGTTVTEPQIKRMMRHTPAVKRAESTYFLHTYHECVFREKLNRIWHIHGEARKVGSVILDHNDYISLWSRVILYVDGRYPSYLQDRRKGKLPAINSWVDAFILGDVYVLGFGFDLSEYDLWWLLDRKSREKAAKGKVYFFRPSVPGFDERKELMRVLDVEYVDCGIVLPDEPAKNAAKEERAAYDREVNRLYKEFYPLALERIRALKAENEQD